MITQELTDHIRELAEQARDNGDYETAIVLFVLAGTRMTTDEGMKELARINRNFAEAAKSELERMQS